MLAGQLIRVNQILGSDSHVIAVERICQPVLQKCVRQLRVAHTKSAACFGQGKGCLARILHSTGNNDFGITAMDGLGT
ncbi:hypothetical protein D9M68_998020 [compost metagenome]